MSFTVQALDTHLWCVELERPASLVDPLGPSNVYVSLGPNARAGLINIGHPAQTDALRHALRSLDISPSQVDRVVYTSWAIDVLGGATGFPQADHFVVSPDMHRPHHYEEYIARERAELRDYTEWLRAHFDLDADELLDRYLPPSTNHLQFVPIRNGMQIAVGNLVVDVITTPGFDEGHAMLFDPDSGLLFSGALEFNGLPRHVTDVQGYLIALERALKLNPGVVAPNRGSIQIRGAWSLKRALRFANGFLTSAQNALRTAPTLADFVQSDLGRVPDTAMEFGLRMRQHRPFLDELVRTRTVSSTGAGLDMRYGDPAEA